MKPQEIQVGRIYHDGKVGLREVFKIGGLFVSYRLLAGKVTRQQRLHGVDRTITLAAFAVWAKVEISPVEAHMLLNLQAAKIKLTPEECMYIDCLLSDPTHLPYTDGRYVLYGQNHGCALAGLEKNGLLLRLRDGWTAEILALGASLLNALGAKAVRKAEDIHTVIDFYSGYTYFVGTLDECGAYVAHGPADSVKIVPVSNHRYTAAATHAELAK